MQIGRKEFSAPPLLDDLLAAGVLSGDDEMYLQLDDRRQYLIFLFHDVARSSSWRTPCGPFRSPGAAGAGGRTPGGVARRGEADV